MVTYSFLQTYKAGVNYYYGTNDSVPRHLFGAGQSIDLGVAHPNVPGPAGAAVLVLDRA